MPTALRARVLRKEFLLQVSVLALDRWDRLSTDEQSRFRALARRSGDRRQPLSKPEDKELRLLWRKLEVRSFVGEAARLLARGERSNGAPPGAG